MLQTGAPFHPTASAPPAVASSQSTTTWASTFRASRMRPWWSPSPEGHGIQCHRAWEALYAGAVPMTTLTDSPIDRIYDGLPVILVRAWQDLLPGAGAAAMTAETRAAALVLGALTRIGVALRNSERVEALQDQRRTLEASGRVLLGG